MEDGMATGEIARRELDQRIVDAWQTHEAASPTSRPND
jgi:hypothetical protein